MKRPREACLPVQPQFPDLPRLVQHRVLDFLPDPVDQAALALADPDAWQMCLERPELAMFRGWPERARARLESLSRETALVPGEVAPFLRQRPYLRRAVEGRFRLHLGQVFEPADLQLATASLQDAFDVRLTCGAAVGPRPQGRLEPGSFTLQRRDRPLKLGSLVVDGGGRLHLSLRGQGAFMQWAELAIIVGLENLGGLHVVACEWWGSTRWFDRTLESFFCVALSQSKLWELSIESCPKIIHLLSARKLDLSQLERLTLRDCPLLGDGLGLLGRLPRLDQLDTRGTAIDLDDATDAQRDRLARLSVLDGEAQAECLS